MPRNSAFKEESILWYAGDNEPGPIEGLPTLVRLSKAAKQLDLGANTLRGLLPDEAVYRLGRTLLVDVSQLAEWLAAQRQSPKHTALRQEFAKRVARRRNSALRESVQREVVLRRAGAARDALPHDNR